MVRELVTAACSNNGDTLYNSLMWIGGLSLGTVTVSSGLANLRGKLPPNVVKVLDILALNFAKKLAADAATQTKA